MLAPHRDIILMGRPNPLAILGADLLAYWDAARPSTISYDGSGLVSSWKDIKFGYDATQGTGSAKPVYSATSFNGAPGLTFDGTDDCLTATDAALLAALPNGANASELWCLIQQDALAADAANRYAGGYGGSGFAQSRVLGRTVSAATNRAWVVVGDGATAPTKNDATVNLSSRHVERAAIGGTSTTLTVDGGSSSILSVIPATVVTRFRFGATPSAGAASLFWQGQIALLAVTADLSSKPAKAAAFLSYLLNRRRL